LGLLYSDLNTKYDLTLTGWRNALKLETDIEHDCQKHILSGNVRVRSKGRKKWNILPREFNDEIWFAQ
jgi:hypothetical protein